MQYNTENCHKYINFEGGWSCVLPSQTFFWAFSVFVPDFKVIVLLYNFENPN